jgi:hypothetical protein
MVDASLDHLAQGQRLVLSRHDEHHLPRVHDGLDADGERHAGHSGEVVVEETAVVEDGLVGEGLDAGAGDEGGAGLRGFSGDVGAGPMSRRGCWSGAVGDKERVEQGRMNERDLEKDEGRRGLATDGGEGGG